MLRVLFDLLRRRDQTHSTHAFPIPALRKVREGRATHPVGDGGEIKNLGHPAN